MLVHNSQLAAQNKKTDRDKTSMTALIFSTVLVVLSPSLSYFCTAIFAWLDLSQVVKASPLGSYSAVGLPSYQSQIHRVLPSICCFSIYAVKP